MCYCEVASIGMVFAWMVGVGVHPCLCAAIHNNT